MVPFWEVVDRAVNSGPLTKVEEFEKRLFKKTLECVKKYQIRYNPETPVVCDDAMISRLFEAGLALPISREVLYGADRNAGNPKPLSNSNPPDRRVRQLRERPGVGATG